MEFFRVFLKTSINEKLVHYTINPEEAQKIDPISDRYLLPNPQECDYLPAGSYFITQIRKEKIDNSELLDLAIELQKEALWNRFKPGNTLIVRSFFEDNNPVVQLWRNLQNKKYEI